MASPPPLDDPCWRLTSIARPAVRDAATIPSDRYFPQIRKFDCLSSIIHIHDARDDPTAAAAAAEQEKIFIAEGSKRGNPIFFLDSGSSCHVASDIWLFSRLDVAITIARENCLIADRTRFPVTGTGTIASKNFHLPDVLYIPGMMPGKILVSIPRLVTLGYVVMFGGGQCRVMDPAGDKLVGQGPLQRDDGLYRLEFLKIPPDDADAADGMDSTGP